MRQIDNSVVLVKQTERLQAVRAKRDAVAVRAALEALEAAARDTTSPREKTNLMEFAVVVRACACVCACVCVCARSARWWCLHACVCAFYVCVSHDYINNQHKQRKTAGKVWV